MSPTARRTAFELSLPDELVRAGPACSGVRVSQRGRHSSAHDGRPRRSGRVSHGAVHWRQTRHGGVRPHTRVNAPRATEGRRRRISTISPARCFASSGPPLLPAQRARLPMVRLSRERSPCRFAAPRRTRAVRTRCIATFSLTRTGLLSRAGRLPPAIRAFTSPSSSSRGGSAARSPALSSFDGDRRIYIDFPAEFRGPGADLWRADDGGEVHPEGFEVVFLLKRGDAYVLGIDWKGAEGSALSIWGAEPGTQFKEVLTDFWYRSPL